MLTNIESNTKNSNKNNTLANIQVESMNIISKSSYYVYLVTLFVNNTTEIDRCIKEINKVKHVTETVRKVD